MYKRINNSPKKNISHIIFIIYYRFNINGKTYKESEYFNIDGIIFKVTESFITDVDLNGNIINEEKNYILVNLNIENTNKVKSSLSVDTLRLRVDGENYYPIYSKNDYFIDLGEGYYKNTLYAGQTYDYLLVYEIPSNSDYNDAILKVKNVPVLYTPYLSHPAPKVKRRSGFLAPTIGKSSYLGATLQTPYFFDIDEHQDFTFSPIFTSDKDVVLTGKYNKYFSPKLFLFNFNKCKRAPFFQ